MNKNIIKFFLLTTLILLLSMSLVSASDITNDTSSDTIVSVENNVKNVDKEVKINNEKLSDSSTDYYVSDTSGSDTNQGTSSSPFKTIQTALNKTTSTGTYNIYIGTGTYKGVGNTNLTVNGSHTINLIGDGINKTVLDGEVNYTIISTGSAWGNNEYWNGYTINSGNWGLNITNGIGKITISNLNIQNMVSRGGSSISAYTTAPIDNYGNLGVDNVYFHNNLAGVGAGIRNNANSTLLVNNSVFEGNRKSSSTGNIGAGVYNNGTCTITNTNFTGNAARWGTVTNDNKLNISNCTFYDGISYDLGSTYKFGSGIASNTGSADFFNPYQLYTITNITNCSFINNGQTDVYQGLGDLYINNCNFTNSTGVYIENWNNNSIKHVINGSTFNNMQPSTLFGSLSTITGTTFAIYDAGYNTIIENNTINVNNNGYGIRINSNATIKNNTLNNQIYITGTNNNIENNTINTTFYYAIQNINSSNTIKDNALYSYILTGNNAVYTQNENNIITDNTPNEGVVVNLTDSNYDNYFDNNGIIKNTVENKSIITLNSNLTNKNLVFDNTMILFRNPSNYTLFNTSIEVEENAKVILDGLKINNTDINNYTILAQSSILIKDTQIYVNDTNPNQVVIIINGDDSELRNLRITAYLPDSTNETIGLVINSSNNILNNINIFIYNNTVVNGEIIGLIINNSVNTQLIDAIIYVNGYSNATAIKILNSSDISLILGSVITNASIQTKQIESINTRNLSITTSGFNSTAQYGYGIILNNNNNTQINIDDIYYLWDTDVNYRDVPYFQLNATLNLTGILLNNTNNTLITSTNSRSRIQLNATYIKAIEAINTENTTIQYISFNNLAQNNRYVKIITSMDIKDSKNIYINNVNMSINETRNTNGSLLILNNTNNTEIINNAVEGEPQLKFIINITDTPIRLINSNNNTINNLTITTEQNAITLINSNNNKIINNNISTTGEVSITLANSNDNTITENYINANDINGGDSAINETNSNNNTIENNTPIIIYLTDTNYNTYFTNQTLNPDVLMIMIDSNIYNKNMTFINSVFIKNNNNYIIYNTTLTSNHTITLENIKIHVTDDRINIINTTGKLTIRNSSIYQENKNLHAWTISSEYLYMNDTNITVKSPEVQTNTTQIITTSNEYVIYRLNMNLITNNNQNGTVIAINSTSFNTTRNNILRSSNITLNGNGNITGFYGRIRIYDDNINIISKNIANGIITPYGDSDIQSSNFTAHAKYVWIAVVESPYNYTRFKQFTIYNSYITTNGTNYTKLLMKNILPAIYSSTWNDTPGILRSTLNITNGLEIICVNASRLTFQDDVIVQTVTQSIPMFNITNCTSITIYYNEFESIGSNGEYLIDIFDSSNIQVTYNYLKTAKYLGNHAIFTNNSTNINITENMPEIILNENNYDTYFTEGVLNNESIESLELGSDFHNKNFTFDNQMTIFNHNNYTLFNGTVYSNSTLNITGLNIINTDDRKTSISAESYLHLNKVYIYQENKNTYAEVIKLTNVSSTSAFIIESINGSNIIFKGNGTIIDLHNSTKLIVNNTNINAEGNNITVINLINSNISYFNGKISLEANNSVILHANNSTGNSFINYTEIYEKGDNLNLLNLINSGSTSLNYNNITVIGNGTIIKVENTTTPMTYNNIYGNGDNITAITIENKTTANSNIRYNNITLESDNPTTAIKTINSKSVTIRDNIILVKAYNNETPIINISNGVSPNTIRGNYLESYDTHGLNSITVTGVATINVDNAPNETLNITIHPTTPKTVYMDNTNINITITDLLDRPIDNGILEITYNNQTTNITVNDSTATYTFTPINTGTNTINFTFTPTNTTYITTNKTITIEVSKYNTTINMTNIVGKINKTTTITPQVFDELLNNVTGGNITVSDENGTILANSTVSNGTSNLNLKFNITGNKTLVITYAGTDKYERSTINITTTITKLNTTVTVDNVVGVVGESITLIARVVDEQGDNVTSGRVLFKINGVTLRYTNGSVIYVNVTNGVAKLTLTAVRGWTNTNAYISANYAGNNVYLTSVSKNSSVSIAKRNATIEIINDTRVYKAGDTITITAMVTDSNGQLAMSGQVVFKLNGVTLKDKNGKTIMVNVINGIATLTYTLPSTFADYNYTITAIFAGGDYNRQVSKNSTLQVVKTSIHMDLDPVITTTNTAVVRAKIYDGNNNQITGTTRVSIKLNGVTIINSQNITNGNLQFTINTPYKTGLYNMTIIAGPSSVYEQLQRNTTLVIMKN